MSVFISDKLRHGNTLHPIFLHWNNPKSKYWCKIELIYIRDIEDVQKTRTRVLLL